MIQEKLEIINRLGLHARAAAKLVDCAARYSARIQIGREGDLVDAKSIMSVMMLAAGKGTVVDVIIDGEDETQALEALRALIADRFGEPD